MDTPMFEGAATPYGHESWSRLQREFLACHRSAANVALHLLTTPLGILGVVSVIASFSPVLAAASVLVYLCVLWSRIPQRVFLVTALTLALLVLVTISLNLSFLTGVVLVVVGYFLQDMAHVLTGEPTMQSGYAHSENRLRLWFEHTLFLLPLVFASFWKATGSVFGFLVPRNAVLRARLSGPDAENDLRRFVDFIEEVNPSREHTYHRWQAELEPELDAAFDRLARAESILEMFRELHGRNCEIDVLREMNEVYVAGPMKALSSDSVFKTPHIDGPWILWPFAAAYRCMVATSENKRVTTHFPMNGESYDRPLSYLIDRGDAVAFDYNREPHYITINRDIPVTSRRVNLKVHYVVYPRWWKPAGRLLGRLSVQYNERA